MKKLLIWAAILTVLTGLLIRWAYISRGYWAVGAEWFWWVVPALVLAADDDVDEEEEAA